MRYLDINSSSWLLLTIWTSSFPFLFPVITRIDPNRPRFLSTTHLDIKSSSGLPTRNTVGALSTLLLRLDPLLMLVLLPRLWLLTTSDSSVNTIAKLVKIMAKSGLESDQNKVVKTIVKATLKTIVKITVEQRSKQQSEHWSKEWSKQSLASLRLY